MACQDEIKKEAELQKNRILKDIRKAIKKQQDSDSIELFFVEKENINKCEFNKIMIDKNTILFELDFKKDNILKGIDKEKKISIIFQNTIFKKAVYFKNINLEKLELKEVTFEKNVGIKDVKIDTLILRPYEINGHIVVNVDGYADYDNGIIVKNDKKSKNEEHFIKNIKFEDPHVSNAKIYFVGTEFENGDFTNRNLRDVIFQNCDFQNTYFLNSFVDKTTFLNCKFPTIRNDNDTLLLPKRMTSITYFLFSIFIALIMWYLSDSSILGLSLILLMIPTWFYIIVDIILHLLNKLTNDPKEYLINHHIGIADERKLLEEYLNNKNKGERKDKLGSYDITLQNINAIYNDLKVNFKNVSNFQQSGDFYYAQNLTKIILSLRPFEVIVLKLSFMINGFGERYVRSFVMIVLSLIAIGNLNNPNIDYVSTQATPSFLLDLNNTTKSNFQITDYNISNFLILSRTNFKDSNSKFISTPAYDNIYDFKYNEQRIPKLNDTFSTRFYYATSHITAPFTQENKKWFKNMTDKSYGVSFPITIFIWLCFVGMVTAIFNRIRR